MHGATLKMIFSYLKMSLSGFI